MPESKPQQRLRIAIILMDRDDRDRLDVIESKLQCQLSLNADKMSINNLLIQIIENIQTSAIRVTFGKHNLYFVNDLTCAQLKLHPHAYLCGFHSATSKYQAQKLALQQSKRRAEQVKHLDTTAQSFSSVIGAITALASRTLATQSGKDYYWFMPQHQSRVLQLDVIESERYSSLVLVQGTEISKAKPLLNDEQLFFVVCADSINELMLKTQMLGQETWPLQQRHDVVELNQKYLQQYNPNAKLALVLQAKNLQAFTQELQQFLTSAQKQQNHENWHWQTPNGSCFVSAKYPTSSGLTFVYPGVGTTYSNMLSELHEYFPALYQNLEKQLDLTAMLQANRYYSDDAPKPTLSQQAISGVGVSFLLTKLLTQEFKVQPELALGYSMGESAMWASLGVWQQPETLIEKTANSEIFNQQISGELNSVKTEWQLNNEDPINWNSFVVRACAIEIEALINDYSRVYLVITQGETSVIAGDEQQCQSLLQQLGKRGIASNMVTAMHTPASKKVKQQLTEFYSLPLMPTTTKTQFISASSNKPIDATHRQAIAKSISTTFTEILDFAKVIKTAKQHGSKIFLEVGADRQTASIIEKITKNDTDTHSLAINSKGQSTITRLLKCIAQLISLRVPISLAPLMHIKR